MKWPLLAALLVTPVLNASADDLFPLCVKTYSRCGFIDRSGDWVIDPVFEQVGGFADNGLAPASKNRKFGYIDQSGEWAIAPQFSDADPFEASGVAKVSSDYDHQGLIDKSGDFVFGPVEGSIYTNVVWELSEVKVDGKSGLVNDAGNWIVEPTLDGVDWWPKADLVAAEQGELWGYLDKQGEWVIEPQLSSAYAFAENGLARASFTSSNLFFWLVTDTNYNEGFINRAGEWAIPQKFAQAKDFSSEGFAPAEEDETDLWGVIDNSGDWVVEPKFHSIGAFGDNGLAVAELDEKYGVIDATGAWIVKPRFGRLNGFHSFNEAEAAIGNDWDNYKWGVINIKGQWIVRPRFDDVSRFRGRDLAKVQVGDQYGLVDRSGKTVVPPVFGEIEFVDDLIKVTDGRPRSGDSGDHVPQGYLNSVGTPLTFESFWKRAKKPSIKK